MRLIAAQHVRPFVRTNKTDGADARAIWEAAQRPEVKWVAIKSEASQAVLSLHRMREQLKEMRRMQSNQLKALLYEFGVVGPARITAAQLEDWVSAGHVPALLQASLCEQIGRIARLKQQERELTRAIERHNASDALAMQLLAVPGIGVLSASALSAELAASAKSYANGRQFAACKGIAPRLSGTGGKVRPGAISKRGLLERRPLNVAVVALANKMARTAWALAAHGRAYQQDYGAQAA